jgi:hypothetical protein
LLADLMIFCPLGPIGQTNFKNSALTIPCILHKTWKRFIEPHLYPSF